MDSSRTNLCGFLLLESVISLTAMLWHSRNKVLVGATSIGFALVCALSTYSQTSSSTQSIPIRSQQDLALALLKAQTERPADVQSLLRDNTQFLSEAFWQEILNAATKRYAENQHERAFLLYAIARQVAAELKSQKLLAKTYYYLGRSYSGLNQFDKAKAAYLESKKAFAAAGLERDLIYILSDLGTLSFIQEEYAAARSYSEESVKLADSVKGSVAPHGAWPDEFGVAGALSTLGELAAREGDISQALDYLQRSLTLYQRLNDAESSYGYYLADVHASLGRVYTAAGDNVQALAVLNKALVISKALKNQQQEASRLNDIGFLYMEQEDYAQARAKFKESLSIYRLLKNPREESRVLLNLGVIEQREARYDEALVYFHSSLEAAKATETVDVQIAATQGIGVAFTGKKDFVAAVQVLADSLALSRKINDRTRQAELVWRTAEVRYEMGDFAGALQLAQTALDKAREIHNPKLAYLVTATIGRTYAALNKTELAIQTLKNAVARAEEMRDQVAGREEAQQLFFESKISSYNSLIELLIKQGNTFDALVYAELAKGRVLLDVLRSGRSDIAKYLTPSEKEQTQLLNRKISDINDRIKIEESAGSSLPGSLYRQLDAARLEYQSFQNALYASRPDLRLRSGRTPPLTTEDLNYLTLNNCAYLEYVVTQERIYLFVLSPEQTSGVDLKVYEIASKSETLAKKVEQFHQRLANRHPDFANTARELYAALIEPAIDQLSNISTICIVPDGFLWNVPFQALMSTSNRYLIEDRALYYAPSLSVLSEMDRARASQDKRPASIIAFGNPVIGRDEQRNEELCPLPEAATEVTSIAKTLTGVNKRVLIGREASEQTFRAIAPTFTTIHLATHGVLDNRQPLYSHLLLTKTEGDSVNDGLLEAREIMNMNLKADLAVLSACETANGRIAPGEGVMGMSWAFFVAGTKSMLVSQWKVNSASTSKLMVSFYQNLESRRNSSTPSKAVALREASRKLMKEQRYRHPFYWASFVLVGNAN